MGISLLLYSIHKLHSLKSIAPPLWKSDFEYELTSHIYSTVISHALIFILKWVYFLFKNATAPPVLSGLRAKRGKEAEIPINSLPFKAGKGVSNDEAI